MGMQKSSDQPSLIEAMRKKKKEYGYSYGEIAQQSGLPLGTVQKVLGGFTKSPRRETLTALAGFLLPEDHPCELIDGVIYNMYSPTLRHQSVSGAIYRQLWNYAGVRKYWIVDLQKEKVIVYLFGEESDVSLWI